MTILGGISSALRSSILRWVVTQNNYLHVLLILLHAPRGPTGDASQLELVLPLTTTITITTRTTAADTTVTTSSTSITHATSKLLLLLPPLQTAKIVLLPI